MTLRLLTVRQEISPADFDFSNGGTGLTAGINVWLLTISVARQLSSDDGEPLALEPAGAHRYQSVMFITRGHRPFFL